ncbi:MAG: hypothetical protein ACM3PP_06710, partial [Candidatus Saccharibacteria bacterium]
QEQTETESNETGESTAEAGQVAEDQNGDEQSQDAEQSKEEIAWSKRIAAEREKIKEQTTREILDQLRPILEMTEAEAKQQGFNNPLDYARAAQANREAVMEQQYNQFIDQVADEWGVDARMLRDVAMRHPAFQKLGMLEQENGQLKSQLDQRLSLEKQFDEFLGAYPDFNEKPIPPEVFQLQNEKGYTLKEAYEAVSGRTEAERLKQENEQLRLALETKKKNEANAASSPGSVNGQGAPPAEFISRETFEQNKDDRSWVIKNLTRISESRKKW